MLVILRLSCCFSSPQVLDVRKRLGPILHVGEELAEKGERKRDENKTIKPDHKEGDGLEEEAGNGSNSKPQTTPQTSGLETGAAAKTMEDDSDYMEPADAIPRGSSYGFKM